MQTSIPCGFLTIEHLVKCYFCHTKPLMFANVCGVPSCWTGYICVSDVNCLPTPWYHLTLAFFLYFMDYCQNIFIILSRGVCQNVILAYYSSNTILSFLELFSPVSVAVKMFECCQCRSFPFCSKKTCSSSELLI